MAERQIEGVAAFIALPRYYKVLTIEELQTKRSTNKIAGMRSLPMETVEPGESYEEALKRLLREEVQVEPLGNNLTNSRLGNTELCAFQMIPNVWVHAFYIEAHSLSDVKIGSEAREVANLKWEHVKDILNHDLGSRKYRGGNREAVWSYLRWFGGESRPQPDVYEKIVDRVPAYAFDDLEAGRSLPMCTLDEEIAASSRNTELFPYSLSRPLWISSRSLARL